MKSCFLFPYFRGRPLCIFVYHLYISKNKIKLVFKILHQQLQTCIWISRANLNHLKGIDYLTLEGRLNDKLKL